MFDKKEFVLDGYKAVLTLENKMLNSKEIGKPGTQVIRYQMFLEVNVEGSFFNTSSYWDKERNIEIEEIDSMLTKCVDKFRKEMKEIKKKKESENYWNNLDLESLL